MARKTDESTADGMTHEQLRRELGFDELDREALAWELFGELFDEGRPGPARPSKTAKVTQLGRGRRHRPDDSEKE